MLELDILHKYVPIRAERVSDTIRLLIRIAMKSLHADEGSILLVTEDKQKLIFVDTIGSGTTDLSGMTIPFGHGITGMAALTQDVQIGSKVSSTMMSIPGDNDPNSIVAVPLVADDELIGVMTLVRLTDLTPFTLEDGEFYLMLGAIAATVIRQQHQLDARKASSAPMTEGEASKGRVLLAVSKLLDQRPNCEESLLAMINALSAAAK